VCEKPIEFVADLIIRELRAGNFPPGRSEEEYTFLGPLIGTLRARVTNADIQLLLELIETGNGPDSAFA
jgi:hypothetical protein